MRVYTRLHPHLLSPLAPFQFAIQASLVANADVVEPDLLKGVAI